MKRNKFIIVLLFVCNSIFSQTLFEKKPVPTKMPDAEEPRIDLKLETYEAPKRFVYLHSFPQISSIMKFVKIHIHPIKFKHGK